MCRSEPQAETTKIAPDLPQYGDSLVITRRDRVLLALAAIAVLALVVLRPALPMSGTWTEPVGPIADKLQVFATVFLGILIEALPFLLIGVVASSLIHIFVSDSLLARFVPRAAIPAAAIGGVLGLIFPVCDCGAIPVARRLIAKGAPLQLGIAFMLAAPVINPVVIIATWTAFGSSAPTLALARFGAVYLVAVLVALVFGLQKAPMDLLIPPVALHNHVHDHDHDHSYPTADRFARFTRHAADEFFEMGQFLVIGAVLAAALQTFLSRATLLAVGQDPVLSVCSTVDAFVALSFVGIFTGGALLAFLAFGPMVDFKSSFMYTTTLRKPAVILLVVLCAQFVFLIATLLNMFVRL